jgi:hypothetical protein
MKFPWHKYEELPLDRRFTLQISSRIGVIYSV